MEELETIKSPDTERQDRVPPGQRVVKKWHVLHHGNIPDIDLSRWVFTLKHNVAIISVN